MKRFVSEPYHFGEIKGSLRQIEYETTYKGYVILTAGHGHESQTIIRKNGDTVNILRGWNVEGAKNYIDKLVPSYQEKDEVPIKSEPYDKTIADIIKRLNELEKFNHTMVNVNIPRLERRLKEKFDQIDRIIKQLMSNVKRPIQERRTPTLPVQPSLPVQDSPVNIFSRMFMK